MASCAVAKVVPYDVQIFNALHELGEASEIFSAAIGLPSASPVTAEIGSTEAVSALCAVIERHGLEDVAAVHLIHRHFSLAPDERLVERATFGTGTVYSVTKPEAPKIHAEGAAPLVPYVFKMVLGGPRIQAMEFTADNGTGHYAGAIERFTPAFVEEYTAELKARGLEAVTGLCILPPTSKCTAEEWLIESPGAGADERELVLEKAPRVAFPYSPAEYDIRQVTWSAGGTRQRGCRRYCVDAARTNIGRHVKQHN